MLCLYMFLASGVRAMGGGWQRRPWQIGRTSLLAKWSNNQPLTEKVKVSMKL
jgi:hypothetical protein